MNYFKHLLLLLIITLASCKTEQKTKNIASEEITSDFIIAFGSCNNQNLNNNLWEEILKNNPNIWIWGGDVIYSDTEDMSYLKKNYELQKSNKAYLNFTKNIEILETWDDHEYGLNDGGEEYSKKEESQKIFLDFYDVPSNDERRKHAGVYYAKDYTINNHQLKVILLDTRYFRTKLTPDTKTKKRYKPNKYGEGTMLGKTQWDWLKKQLENSTADFNIIVSSIQFLSAEHGFECWGNMPHEIDKLENLLKTTKAKNTIILSGDRHISEISKKEIKDLKYPLIDFTSSGLTHSYTGFTAESNKYRVSNVVSKKSFGLLKFDFKNSKVNMEMRGENNKLYEAFIQKY